MVVNWKVKNECVSTVFLENKSSYMFESSVVLTHPLSQVRMPILEDLYNIIGHASGSEEIIVTKAT